MTKNNHFKRPETGAALLEAALVIPIIFVFAFAAVESANLLSQRFQIIDAARRVGRTVEVFNDTQLSCPDFRNSVNAVIDREFASLPGIEIDYSVAQNYVDTQRDVLFFTFSKQLTCITCQASAISPFPDLTAADDTFTRTYIFPFAGDPCGTGADTSEEDYET